MMNWQCGRFLLAATLAIAILPRAHAIGDSGGCADPLGGPLGQALKTGGPAAVEKALDAWVDARQSSLSRMAQAAQRAVGSDEKGSLRRKAIQNLIEGVHEKGASCVPGPLLIAAVHAGNLEVVRYLLDKPMGIEAKVPPQILFSCNDPGMYQELRLRRNQAFALVLDSGKIDVNASRADGRTALQVCNDPELLKLLLARGARYDTESAARFDLLDRAILDAVGSQEGGYTAERLYAVERARLFASLITSSIRGRPAEERARYSCHLVIQGKRWNPQTCQTLATFIKAAPGTFGD
jgi:hypothetical protein